MHLPSARIVPSEPIVHCWLVPLWQVHSWILAPSVELAPLMSTHLPLAPVIRPVRLPVDVPKVKASTSNRLPVPLPWNVRYSVTVPAGRLDRVVDTSVKVSQPPV